MIDMNKIWIVDLEAVESRYTGQWKTHIPRLLKIHSLIHRKYEIEVIEEKVVIWIRIRINVITISVGSTVYIYIN